MKIVWIWYSGNHFCCRRIFCQTNESFKLEVKCPNPRIAIEVAPTKSACSIKLDYTCDSPYFLASSKTLYLFSLFQQDNLFRNGKNGLQNWMQRVEANKGLLCFQLCSVLIICEHLESLSLESPLSSPERRAGSTIFSATATPRRYPRRTRIHVLDISSP